MEKLRFSMPEGMDFNDDIIDRLLKDPRLQKAINSNEEVKEYIKKSPYLFDSWLNTLESCRVCPGLWACPNSPQGYFKNLELIGGAPMESLKKCRWLKEKDSVIDHRKNYLICDLSEKALAFDINKIDLSGESRQYTDIYEIVREWIEKKPDKGLYLWGDFGVGKSYLAACMTNALAKEGRKVCFVHWPTFALNARNSIGSQDVDDRDYVDRQINRMKRCDCLVLDDIGAENVTNWVRDDLLLPLLDYRMENRKHTHFTSNSSFEQLKKRLSVNQNGQTDEIKSGRIMERIGSLSVEIRMEGTSRRQ